MSRENGNALIDNVNGDGGKCERSVDNNNNNNNDINADF